MGLEFTERQSRTIAAALTTVATLVILVAVGLLGWLAALFLRAFSGVFLPLAVGAVAALVLRPYYEWLRVRARLPVALAVVVVFVSVLAPITVFLAFFGQLLVSQMIELAAHVPDWWDGARLWVMDKLPQVNDLLERSGMSARLRDAATNQQAAIVQWLQALGSQAMTASLGIARGSGPGSVSGDREVGRGGCRHRRIQGGGAAVGLDQIPGPLERGQRGLDVTRVVADSVRRRRGGARPGRLGG